jgi:hypothetical protein
VFLDFTTHTNDKERESRTKDATGAKSSLLTDSYPKPKNVKKREKKTDKKKKKNVSLFVPPLLHIM